MNPRTPYCRKCGAGLMMDETAKTAECRSCHAVFTFAELSKLVHTGQIQGQNAAP